MARPATYTPQHAMAPLFALACEAITCILGSTRLPSPWTPL